MEEKQIIKKVGVGKDVKQLRQIPDTIKSFKKVINKNCIITKN
jgi:hypothetical protein